MTAIAQAFSAALLNFVWQGLLVAFLLWATLFLLKNRSARARYLASCVALAVMAILPAVTASLVWSTPAVPPVSVPSAAIGSPLVLTAVQVPAGASFNWSAALQRWALLAWSAGVLLFSMRLVWASRQISTLRRLATLPEEALLSLIAELTASMRMTRPVRVLISTLADCPSVVGWLRPVVLLPAATVAGLTPQQLEAVLAHELAHILRYDYLVNMLQTIVETLLFYHPAVWWTSAHIRHERELCCDDLVVDFCGDPVCYARALTRLERLRIMHPRLALGSTSGSLLYRIQRLLGDPGRQRGPSKLPGILALSLGLACFALNMQWARGQQDTSAPERSEPDDPGIRIDLGGATVSHRDAIEYPGAAVERQVQGTVVVEATLDASGAVSDARVLSGPPELRKAVLESVLEWHFTPDAAGSTRQVSIAFELPPPGSFKRRSAERSRSAAQARAMEEEARQRALQDMLAHRQEGQRAEVAMQELQARRLAEMAAHANLDRDLQSEKLAADLALLARDTQPERMEQIRELENQLRVLQSQSSVMEGKSELDSARAAQMEAMEKRAIELNQALDKFDTVPVFAGRRLKVINIQGLTSALRSELAEKLPVHVGDTLAEDSMQKIEAMVKEFDEHLNFSMFTTRDGQVEIRISAPDSSDSQ